MIPYNEFNLKQGFKPCYGKQPFSLTLQQLSFLVLLAEKLDLSDDELKLVEYLTYQECRSISFNRFRELNYECVSLAAVLYVFDLKQKDYSVILSLIDAMYPDVSLAASTKAKVYNIYNVLYNDYRNAKIDPNSYEGKKGALKLKK